ncbi:MAG TPA: alpha/beta fold hydrolase [Streptosporangiaceae bacterium]|nr:alpha/beta fold hydrolase [Streptosporangiaceae bacterium]
MTGLYPRIEPQDHGMLDVGDGQSLYWEICGNPDGKPALVPHGGPGSGCSPGLRRYFDPAAYRIVLFDQRGAGRSVPHASDRAVSLAANTTQHLIGDMEALREFLGISRWLVWGISWGSTLALAYAEQHPQRVSEIVLHSVTMTRPADIHWLYHDVGRFFPEEWARFRAGGGAASRASRGFSRTAASTSAARRTPRGTGPGLAGRRTPPRRRRPHGRRRHG